MNIALKQTVALPDHADITAADLPDVDVVIITEKDAVKFSDGHGLNHVWVLPVYAIIEPDLATFCIRECFNLNAYRCFTDVLKMIFKLRDRSKS